jgi:uncharacterized protein YjbI with pentapeptide repeats
MVAIGQAITSFTAIGALLFTGIQLYLTRGQVTAAQEQVEAATRQNEVTEQIQYTDRFTTAVALLDQSGPDHLQGRLGAVYALERLSRDSPRDQPTIIEVLSAFVRTDRARDPAAPESCPSPRPLALDTQAVLTVLGRRNRAHDNGTRVDLSAVCLNGTHLADIDLSDVNLSGADLRGAVLVRTNLPDPNLGNGNLGDVSPIEIAGAHLRGADLTYANLRNTDLRIVDLSFADLRAADLSGADLTGASLNSANLRRADLRHTKLTNANLTDANLTGASHDPDTAVDGTVTGPTTTGQWW